MDDVDDRHEWTKRGLFLADLPSAEWIVLVRELAGRADSYREQLDKIKEAAIEYGANDEVAAAIAHAGVVIRLSEMEK
jgi:hypothetical protein